MFNNNYRIYLSPLYKQAELGVEKSCQFIVFDIECFRLRTIVGHCLYILTENEILTFHKYVCLKNDLCGSGSGFIWACGSGSRGIK